jgi:hypothetical protein
LSLENYIYDYLKVSEDEWEIFKKSISEIESGGNPSLFGGYNNHYDGKYQLGEDAKIDAYNFAKKLGSELPEFTHSQDPDDLSRAEFRKNPEAQEDYFAAFTANNNRLLENYLGEEYSSLSPEQKLPFLAYAHSQGARGAASWAKNKKPTKDGFGVSGEKYSESVTKNLLDNKQPIDASYNALPDEWEAHLSELKKAFKNSEQEYKYSGVPPTTPKKEDDPSILETVAGAGVDFVSGIPLALKSIVDFAGIPVPKSLEKYTTDPLSNLLQQASESIADFAPEDYKQAKTDVSEIFKSTDEGIDFDAPSIQTVVGTVAQSIPQIPAFIYGGGKVKAFLNLFNFFKRKPVLKDVLGYGLVNSALVAPGQWKDTYDYAIDQGYSEEEATQAADTSGLTTGVISLLTGGAGGAAASFLGSRSYSLGNAIAKGIIAESPFEGMEEAGQSVANDLGISLIDEDREIDVLKALGAGFLGSVAGGLPGAAISGIEYKAQAPKRKLLLEASEELQKIKDKNIEESPELNWLSEKEKELKTKARNALDNMGLKDVGIRWSEENETRKGFYSPTTRTIFLSLNQFDVENKTRKEMEEEVLSIIDHEKIHALRELDLFTEQEWDLLTRLSKKRERAGGKSFDQWASETYSDKNSVIQNEEAVAEMLRDGAKEYNRLGGKPRMLSDRIVNFFSRFKSSVQGTGFQTFNDIVSKVEQGDIGQRERQVTRTPDTFKKFASASLDAPLESREDVVLKASEIDLDRPVQSEAEKDEIFTRMLLSSMSDLESREKAEGPGDIPGGYSRPDRFIFKLQDQLIGLKRTEEAINKKRKEEGKEPLTSAESAYLLEELTYGRIEDLANKFHVEQIQPLINQMSVKTGKEYEIDGKKVRGVDIDELDNFLILQHAIERNKKVAQRNINNKEMQDGAAGSLYILGDSPDETRLTNENVRRYMKNVYGFEWDDNKNEWHGGNARGQNLSNIYQKYIVPIIQQRLDMSRETGLITKEDYKNFAPSEKTKTYKYYVPLRGIDERNLDGELIIDDQKNYSYDTSASGRRDTRSSEAGFRTAMGRKSQAFSPLSTIIEDRTRTITRGVKNSTFGEALYNLVKENPDEDLWKIISSGSKFKEQQDTSYTYIGTEQNDPNYYNLSKLAPKGTKIKDLNVPRIVTDTIPDSKTFGKDIKIIPANYRGKNGEKLFEKQISKRKVPLSPDEKKKLFSYKKDGKEYFIDIKDDRLRIALLNSGYQTSGDIIKYLGIVNRGLSFVNTSLNPEFMYLNFFRDLQTALASLATEQETEDGKLKELNIGLKEKIKLSKEVIAGIPKAFKEMRAYLVSVNPENFKGERREAKIDEETKSYIENGAKAGWYHSRPAEKVLKDTQNMLEMANGTFKGNALSTFKVVSNFVENMNSAVENAVRLSGYKVVVKRLVEAGNTQEEAELKAASVAKNMTINFNRKGEYGNSLNSLYLFYNAQAQGTAVIARGLGIAPGSRYKLGILSGIVGFGAFMAMLHDLYDDEDEQRTLENIPDYVRERNMIVPAGLFNTLTLGALNLKDDIRIPLPYGYSAFYTLGQSLALAAQSKISPSQAGSEVLSSFLSSFNPLGAPAGDEFETRIGKAILPTAADPFFEFFVNSNYFGSPVYKENNPYSVPRPDSYMTFKNTDEFLKRLTQGINDLTGGDAYTPGVIDISPNTIEHFLSFGLGGAGRFFGRALFKPTGNVLNKEKMFAELNEVPFLRLMAYEYNNAPDTEKYYDRKDLAAQKTNMFEQGFYRQPKKRREYLEKNRKYLQMDRVFDEFEKRIRKLRKAQRQLDLLIQRNPDKTTLYLKRQEGVQEKIDSLINRANEIYEQRVGRD